jgi:hypothetical protein
MEAARGQTILALLPCGARFSTGYFQDHVLSPTNAVCFVRGRVRFLQDGVPCKNNPYDSAIYGYNVDARRFAACLGPLGRALSLLPL